MKFRRRSRAGLAGIIATLVMFAILFTIGTSYFVFVEAQNTSYTQNLVRANANAQSTLKESLHVSTTLASNGDVAFSASNPTALSINMTAALVISSAGLLLKCDGVGFPAGAGCTNSTPSLWIVLAPGTTSATVDTGYLYVAGTTVNVKVVTARGNSYSATYPSPNQQSTSTQSVTVSLDNLRWVQLIPQASSLVQKKFVSNCNAAACAASFSSNVAAGNILVDALSWPSTSPPSSPPSDTLHDSFTLGASASVNVPSSASLVQNRYASNCNAASCGLAFSSNVGSGHTLVFALGWSNQNAPSAPTDTLGDTFSLGSSKSVTYNPPSAALVQSRYNANCSSATCALAYSSSVTAGNTLALGLGWSGSPTYVPVTITNCPAVSSSPIALVQHGPAAYQSSSATLGVTLGSNVASGDVVVLMFTDQSNVGVSSVSGFGVSTWNVAVSKNAGSAGTAYMYYGLSSGGSSSSTITFSGSDTSAGSATEFSGISNPVVLDGTNNNTGNSANPSTGSITTTNANDLLMAVEVDSNGYGESSPTNGFTKLDDQTTAKNYVASYNIVSSTGTYSTGWTITSTTWGMIIAAFKGSSSMSLDGHNFADSGSPGTTITASLTTTNANDVIIAIVTGQNSATGTYQTPTASDNSGLTWNARSTLQQVSSAGGYSYYGQIFYAIATSTLSSDSIKITWNSAPTHYDTLQVFGVSGANTVNPFDSHSGLPAFANAAFASVTTGNANDFVYGAELTASTGSPTAGSGFSGIQSGTGGSMASEYQLETSTQSGLSVSFSNSGSDADGAFGDAIQQATCAATTPPALDGSCSNTSTTTSVSCSLTTASANDVIYVAVTSVGGSTLSVSGGSLTWTQRGSTVNDGSIPAYLGAFYAVAGSALSGVSLTASATGATNMIIQAFGVSNANTSSPFDPNASVPGSSQGTGASASTTISTNSANDLIIGFDVDNSGSAGSVGSGFTSIKSGHSGASSLTEYQSVSSAQTNLAVTATPAGGSGAKWAIWADAVQGQTGSNTPINFQQMVTWNPSAYSTYEANNLGNIRFCADTLCVTQLYAWLESCSAACAPSNTSATAWVKLASSIASGGTMTIYMVFQSTSTNFDSNYWGEAPTLSGTYGQYDNGANVFNDYAAFQGASLPAGWTLAGAASFVGGTSNTGGVRLLNNAGSSYGTAKSPNSFSTLGACVETSGEYNGGADDIGQGIYSSGPGTGTGGLNPSTTNSNGYYAAYEYYSGSKPALRQATTTLASASSQTMPTSGTNYLFMATCATSSQVTMQYITNTSSQYAAGVYSGLTSTVTYTATITAGGSTSFVGAATGGVSSYAYLFWTRIRLAPPGGNMPSVSFGSLNAGAGVPTISDTIGDTFTLGASVSIPAGLYSLPVTLTNNQNSATASTLQQMITWNPSSYSVYEAADLGNIRFCTTSSCSTQLYGWLESCTASCGTSATSATAWVKLSSSIAANGGTLTIYMVFQSTTTEFDGNYWGEAPNISGTYGQYDNGANVFEFYSNFAGSSLPGAFTTQASSGGYTVNNGITLTAGNTQWIHVYTTGTHSPGVVETNIVSATSSGEIAVAADTTSPTSGGDLGFGTAYRGQDALIFSDVNIVKDVSGTGAGLGTNTPQVSSGIIGLEWPATGTENLYIAYTNKVSATDSAITYGSSHLDLFFYGGAASQSGVVNWMRNRADPPSGVMPSVSLGSVSNTSSTTYYSYIWYATAASSAANTITATFPVSVSGTVSIYELQGYNSGSTMSSTGSSGSGSTAASVTAFTPASSSFVIGNVETASSSTQYTVGSGYTTIQSGAGGCDATHASQGCSEYQSGVGSATTVPWTLSASTTWADAAISFAPLTSATYYSYIWYATTSSSGPDTIAASFSQSVAGSVSIYELSGVTTTGLLSSTGSSSSTQTSSSVTSMTPSTGSVVIGNTEAAATTFTAGSGYTISGTCSSVPGCGEYQTGVGSATTVPMSFSSSTAWTEVALALQPTTTPYYSYIWYATAGSSGADTITTTFGSSTQGSVSLYEVTGYTTSGALSSTGSSSTASTTSSVTSFTPATDSFIVGTAESAASNTFTAGSGLTLVGTCSSVGGCSEYNAGGGGSANTVPATLGTSSGWVEAAMSFSTPFNPQSGIQVNGYPTLGVPSAAALVWEVTFTNVDPQHRSVTLYPQTELAIGSAEYDGFDTDYTQAHYYIIDGLNPGSTTVSAYTSTNGNFVTLQYNVPTTLYFAATVALGSATQAFGTNVLTPFEAYFALSGQFSDGTLYGETIPYPYGIITQANAYTSPTAGATGASVTVSCTTPCYFDSNAKVLVGWLNSAGQLTQLTTFTSNGSGNIPAGVTFQVPTAAAGYYTIVLTDYVNTVFMTFQHT